MQKFNSKVKNLFVIPASTERSRGAQAVIQDVTSDSINSTLDSCFRRNDKQNFDLQLCTLHFALCI